MALTLDAVRQHLKIDTTAEDAVLQIYLAAGIEAAERYTGRAVVGRVVTQRLEWKDGAAYAWLQYAPTGHVHVTIGDGAGRRLLPASIDGRRVFIPSTFWCAPTVGDIQARYRVGPADGADGDPLIELGVLKFVAHAYGNRGDDPANWNQDSGALACWRPYRSMVID